LRKFGSFVWTKEAEEAFRELKRYLTLPPIMVTPEPDEPLLLYITVMANAISMVLVAKRPEPPPPPAAKGASAGESRSQDPKPAEVPREGDTVRSHEPEATLAPEPRVGSRPSEDLAGLGDQEATGLQL
jgi:hypothetical protein